MATTETETKTTAKHVPEDGSFPPVVLDLGKTKGKLIRALKEGEGDLMQDVNHAVAAVRTSLSAELEGKILVPVVVIYQKKPKRRTGFMPFSL